MLVLVADEPAREPSLGPATAEQLATLGVNRIALLRDGPALSIVLEGWAFDPASGADAVAVLFREDSPSVRAFREIGSVVVSASRHREELS